MGQLKFLIIVLIFYSVKIYSAEFTLSEKGFRLPLEFVSKNYEMMRLSPDELKIREHILKINRKISTIEAIEISETIVLVSECLHIDSWILTALIQKESSFKKDAVSPKGAAGLTQFTTIGLKEVNDQLGIRGRVGAPVEVTTYFNERIRGCIDPEWIDLWNRINVTEGDTQFYKLLKDELKRDTSAAIVYGALLLKTFLAFVNTRNTLEAVPLKTSEIYFQALQLYNGEEGNAKVKYARSIFQNLKSLYPIDVNFPL